MGRWRRPILLLLLFASTVLFWAMAVGPLAPPAPQPPDPRDRPLSLKAQKHVVFGHSGDRDLHMSVYFSRRFTGPRPAILFVHGGAWREGDYRTPDPSIPELTRHGFIVASPEYRLSEEAAFPAAIQDLKCAVRFLRSHYRVMGIDPNRIGVYGLSAGGHLAALLATSDDPALDGDGGWPGVSSRVQAAATLAGFSDLTLTNGRQQTPPQVLRFLRGTPEEVPERYREASPNHHASADDPPMLIVHGRKDRGIPVLHARVLADSLLSCGVPVDLVILPDAGHDVYRAEPTLPRRLVRHFEKTLGRVHGPEPTDAP